MAEYFPVNWVDGMKINKTHFIAQYDAGTYQQALGLSALLTDINYGLIPNKNISDPSVKVYVSADNQQFVNVQILHCTAITKSGHIVNIVGDSSLNNNHFRVQIPWLNVPLSEVQGQIRNYFVLISVNPYDRVPSGTINTEETPPRLPFTAPKYEVHLLPVEDVRINSLGSSLLPIGKVTVVDQNVTLQEDYIPPCATVNGHILLMDAHASWSSFLGNIELTSLQIIQKILSRKQQNELSAPIQKICENVNAYISSRYDAFRLVEGNYPPLHIITTIAGLARSIKNAIDIFLGSSKEELLKYIDETCGIKQAEYENAIGNLCNIEYNHFEIAASLEIVNEFVKLTSHLFSSLLALDYIGKRKEAGIFVKEQVLSGDRSRFGHFLADE